MGKPDPGQPVARPATTRTENSSSEPFQNTDTVEAKLKDLPPVRPEKVHRAKGLITDVKYPPDEMLVGIANLLAMQIK